MILKHITGITFLAAMLLAAQPASSKEVPLHIDSTWPVDVAQDLRSYSKYVAKQDSGKARTLRQAANRLKAARLLYPSYPKLKTKLNNKRFRNCLPKLEDLKLLRKAADYYVGKSPDKAIYASIYCMRLIGRDSERSWKVAPTGPIKESKAIVDKAYIVVDENVGKRHPARIPILLARAYFYLHSGQEKLAILEANEAITTAKTRFGSGSRQLVSTIKYTSLIFTYTKQHDKYDRMLTYERKISTDPFTRAKTKADFYY